MKALFSLCLAALFSLAANAQNAKIISGPMAGYSTMMEAGIWVQLDQNAEVKLEYWKDGSSDKIITETYNTSKNEGFTARFKVGELEPGNTYHYHVLINNQVASEDLIFKSQALWQHRTDPPAFKLALGSCAYINEPDFDRPGKPYGRNYQTFESMAKLKPDVTLWLGDNIYLREPDWSSWSGYMHRYTHTRSTPEMQNLLKTGHHYAIWDDHDFGPNDADGSWLHKDWAMKSFELFWMNPSFGVLGLDGNITAFEFNDVDFFLLDNRYNRSPIEQQNEAPEMFGKAQIDWLINMLKYSKSPFKLVAAGGQILNDAKVFENYARFEEERAYLLKRINDENIKGVIFLTGDRHHSELSKMILPNGNPIYDLTVSPLTSGAHDALDEKNTFRVSDTHFASQNFAIAQFSGALKNRVMTIKLYDFEGKLIWTQEIKGAY